MIKLKKNPSAPASLSSQKCKDALKTIRRKNKRETSRHIKPHDIRESIFT